MLKQFTDYYSKAKKMQELKFQGKNWTKEDVNYIPKVQDQKPFGTHGFGNFWIVEQLRKGVYLHEDWIKAIPENRFCDVKGYLLPMIKGGLRNYIINEAMYLVNYITDIINTSGKTGIKNAPICLA